MDEEKVFRLQMMFSNEGITDAIIIEAGVEYSYNLISINEFQFGRAGNAPKSYFMEPDNYRDYWGYDYE